jgi:carbon monoxide dehydrogenase subunit G
MIMNGEEIIPAPRAVVWAAINDTDVLKSCIPGCQSIVRHSPTKMEATVMVKMGPVKAGFSGVVTLSDIDAPNGCRISGEGKGGLAGYAKGGADVKLTDVPEGTKLSYNVDAQVGGKMAMLGSRLIDSTARSLAGQFFEKFAAAAAAMAGAKGKAHAGGAEAAAKPAKKAAAKKAAVKKAPAKKVVAKKAAAKKPAAKKAAAKKKR